MTPRWQVSEEIALAAAKLSEAERGDYIGRACAGDDELRLEVESIVSEGDSSGVFVAPTALSVTRQLSQGQMVGPYRVVSCLGEGGMGVVYKALDTRLDRTVALKFLKTGFSGRFQREARAISSLSHPHVAALYDLGDHEGVPFLVLEYAHGKPLKGPLPLASALDCAIQIASALEAAHAAGIVHRDLKPGNILCDAHGNVKVLDFGLARRVRQGGGEDNITGCGMIVGTAAYMSPEQAQGRKLDTRSDIFSFGSVLYEMLSGHQAFEGQSFPLTLAAVLGREPAPLSGVPDQLKQVLCHCVRKDPARRWQHVADVRLALEDVRTALERGPERAPVSRRRLIVALASLAGAALIATGYLAWRSSRVEPQTSPRSFAQATDDPGQELNPSLSPDGKTLLYSSRASGNWDIYLLRVGGRNPINLTKDSPADDTQPAFSPDGERIVFRSERNGGGLFVMGATGESVRRLTDFCYLPAWSPDGKEIACSTVSPYRPDVREVNSSQIHIIDVESANRRLVSGDVRDAVQPSWSPDGGRIAFWGLRDSARQIFTVSRTGEGVVPLTEGEALDWDPVWAPAGKYIYFSSDRGGSMNLWRVPVDAASGKRTGDPEPLNVPSTYAAGISFSRDGKRMAYMNCLRSSNLFRIDFDASREAAVGAPKPITQGLKEALYPSISHDGEWLAFTLQGLHEDIVVAKPDGSQMRHLTEDSARDRSPRWSPDGSQLVFTSNRNGPYEIWTIRADGSRLHQVTEASPAGGVNYPAWSPDGGRLSYNLADEMAFIIQAGKSWKEQQPELAQAEVPEHSWFWVNDWSHDGSKLAGTIQKLDGGTFGIAAYSMETRKLERVTDFGQLPRWLPDGRRLLFQAGGRIYLADQARKQTKEVLSVPDGTVNPYFDLSWDGRTIFFSLEGMESDIWTIDFAGGLAGSQAN